MFALPALILAATGTVGVTLRYGALFTGPYLLGRVDKKNPRIPFCPTPFPPYGKNLAALKPRLIRAMFLIDGTGTP